MTDQKRCCKCQKIMKRKLPGAYLCNCGTAWMQNKGFFQFEPGMEFYLEEMTFQGVTGFIPRLRNANEKEEPAKEESREPRWKQEQEASSSFQRVAQQIVRGGIYFVDNIIRDGHEQHMGRPCVVVSDVTATDYTSIVTVVPLTTRDKELLSTRTIIRSSGKRSLALCEQVTTIDCRKMGDFMGLATPDEMTAIKRCLFYHLGQIHNIKTGSFQGDTASYIRQLQADNTALKAQLEEQTAIARKRFSKNSGKQSGTSSTRR